MITTVMPTQTNRSLQSHGPSITRVTPDSASTAPLTG